MSIIECPECKKQVSDSADACPNCGFAVKAYVQKQETIERIKKESEREAIAYVERKMAEKEAAQKQAAEERILQKNRSYEKAIELFNKHTVVEVKEAGLLFEFLKGWKESDSYLKRLDDRLEIVKQEEAQKQLLRKKIRHISIISATSVLVIIAVIISLFSFIIPSIKYNNSIDKYDNGDYLESCKGFLNLGDYSDSEKWFIKSVAALNKHNIVCDSDGIIAITNKGTLVTSESEKDYQGADSITSLSYGSSCLATLNEYGNINTFGGRFRVDKWNDIVFVSSGGDKIVAVQKDGSLQTEGSFYDIENISEWTNIAMVSLGQYHSVGLKADGTVVADGKNDSQQCNVEGWKSIVSVSAGLNHTLGLKTDGTVVATGNNDKGQCNTEDWKDIIAVVAGSKFSVGLKSDGTLVATGNNDANQCNISDWKDIVEITISYNKTVGLTKDGKVITTSKNEELNKAISKWDNINTIKAPIPEQYEIEPKKEATHLATEKATQKPTQAPTEKPTEAYSLYEPEGNPILIEEKLAELKDYEGLWYDKSVNSSYNYKLTIKKDLTFDIGKYSDAAITCLIYSDLPIKSEWESYYQVIYDGKKYYHISFTFYKNGVVIDGLDGIDNGNDCNGFYAYDSIVVVG